MPHTYANGYSAEEPDLSTVECLSHAIRIKKFRRAGDGSWRMVLQGTCRFKLEDGRELVFEDEVRMKGWQVGRKPKARTASKGRVAP